MLNKQQKHFRKEMEKIKREKGPLYYEIYDEYTPNRPWRDTISWDCGRWVRLIIFLSFIGWRIYSSGILASMLDHQGTVTIWDRKEPAILANMTSPFEQKRCSDYLQSLKAINGELSHIIKNYSQGNITYSTARGEIYDLLQEFEKEESIEYGEFLHENTVEKLILTLDYIAAHEELKMIHVIHTEEEEAIWRQKYEHKEELINQLQKNSDDQIDIIKILLEKYNMRYTEKADKGIKYYYKK